MEQYLVTPKQMKAAEQYSEQNGISCARLMDNVGRLTAYQLDTLYGVGEKKILILCGAGNNGGDGFAAAKYLSRLGADTEVLLLAEPKTALSKQCYERCAPYFSAAYTIDNVNAESLISGADIILDCVYGTGFHGTLDEITARLFSTCNKSKAVRCSIDIASGCDASSGEADEHAFCADVTFAAGAVKTGQIISPAAKLSGKIITLDIGIENYPEYTAEINTDSLFKLLPKRERLSHKGNYGRLLNIAGSDRFIGAAWLSTNAAMRIGTGIVELASIEKVISAASASLHECIFLPLKNSSEYIDAEDIKDILKSAEHASAITVGCGMGYREDTRLVVNAVIENAKCPVLIDADGINSLSGHINGLKDNANRLLLTPHPKEFSRISSLPLDRILSDPLTAARDFAKEYKAHILLKGAYSVIAAPDGRAAVNMSGCSALAKGGSGDCLTGTVGGLLAQGKDEYDALRLGTYIAGLAAERASLTRDEGGILPGELAELYPYILKEYR